MSKLTNRVIIIPDEVKLNYSKDNEINLINIKGPIGERNLVIHPEVEIKIDQNKLTTNSANLSLAGTFNSLILSSIEGVTKGFEEKLEVRGVGYKVFLKDNKLEFHLGKSHYDYIEIPQDLKVRVDDNKITINGIDKQKVRKFAINEIKPLRFPSVYKKNKGIYLEGEEKTFKIKPGKSLRK